MHALLFRSISHSCCIFIFWASTWVDKHYLVFFFAVTCLSYGTFDDSSAVYVSRGGMATVGYTLELGCSIFGENIHGHVWGDDVSSSLMFRKMMKQSRRMYANGIGYCVFFIKIVIVCWFMTLVRTGEVSRNFDERRFRILTKRFETFCCWLILSLHNFR